MQLAMLVHDSHQWILETAKVATWLLVILTKVVETLQITSTSMIHDNLTNQMVQGRPYHTIPIWY